MVLPLGVNIWCSPQQFCGHKVKSCEEITRDLDGILDKYQIMLVPADSYRRPSETCGFMVRHLRKPRYVSSLLRIKSRAKTHQSLEIQAKYRRPETVLRFERWNVYILRAGDFKTAI